MSGLTVGAVYGLIGIGFTGIYNVTGIVNFAQGDMAMIGAMIGIGTFALGVPLSLAVVIGILAAALLSSLLERWVVRYISHDLLGAVIVTIAIGVALQGAAVAIWGTDARALPAFSGEKPINVFGATIPPQGIWVVALAALFVLLLNAFFSYTYLGKAFRACAVNRFAAEICGIDARRISNIAFILSGVLGAAAGLVVSPITFIQYDTGIPLAIKGFTACVIGGLGNPFGAMVGGLALGVIEAMSSGFVSSGFKNAIAFVLLLLFLAVKPDGLFGDLERSGR